MAVEKTIKLYSEPLTLDELISLETLLDYREACKNYFYSRFSGIEYLDKLKFRDERINYYAKKYNIKVVYVSAAYTSQFCSKCGARLDNRTGIHHEIGHCPNCGEIDANINAAKNIKARLYDSEIQLFTPYKQIEKILLDRYEKMHKQKA